MHAKFCCGFIMIIYHDTSAAKSTPIADFILWKTRSQLVRIRPVSVSVCSKASKMKQLRKYALLVFYCFGSTASIQIFFSMVTECKHCSLTPRLLLLANLPEVHLQALEYRWK